MVIGTNIVDVPEGLLPGIGALWKNYWPVFLEGVKYTLLIALISTILGLVLAIILTPLKILKVTSRDHLTLRCLKRMGNFLATVYVEVLRGTPMMVQASIVFYGLLSLGVDLTLNLFGVVKIPGLIVTAIAVVSINTSAYMIEVLRGSIEAIDKGQMEAARSLGMTHMQAMFQIIIPQAIKNSIPAIGNEFVINIKDTSVLSVIAVTDLFYMTDIVNAKHYRLTEGFIIAAILYLIMTFTTTRILYWISHRLGTKTESLPTSQSFFKKVFK